MIKHAVSTRTTMIVALFVSLFGLGSCTKHVTQVVDQGFSAIYTIHNSDWTTDTYTGTGAYTGNGTGPLNQYAVVLNVPEVDDQIVANGAVMVYLSFDGGNTYDELPAEEGGVSYNTLHWKSSVYIGFHTLNGSTPSLPSGDVIAKVVILDATPLD
ncbi:MAG TPA: hypothetical protein VHD83_00735 [Puia sp.]|nr:hypothetical protein [Puia sp.]